MGSIKWCGLDWSIRQDNGGPWGPGPNWFPGTGISVDANGLLHMKVENVNGKWNCSELQTVQKFGQGKFTWILEAAYLNGKQVGLNATDPNIVVGMFLYPTSDLGPDGTHEIDDELSRWGDPKQQFWENCSTYGTVTKNQDSFAGGQIWRGKVLPPGIIMTNPQGHEFERVGDTVKFSAWDVYTGVHASQEEDGLTPLQLSQAPMPVHMNLWLNKGVAPVGPVEYVFRSFNYTPAK